MLRGSFPDRQTPFQTAFDFHLESSNHSSLDDWSKTHHSPREKSLPIIWNRVVKYKVKPTTKQSFNKTLKKDKKAVPLSMLTLSPEALFFQQGRIKKYKPAGKIKKRQKNNQKEPSFSSVDLFKDLPEEKKGFKVTLKHHATMIKQRLNQRNKFQQSLLRKEFDQQANASTVLFHKNMQFSPPIQDEYSSAEFKDTQPLARPECVKKKPKKVFFLGVQKLLSCGLDRDPKAFSST